MHRPPAIDVSIGFNSMGMTEGYAAWLADISYANLESAGHFMVQLLGIYFKVWFFKGGEMPEISDL